MRRLAIIGATVTALMTGVFGETSKPLISKKGRALMGKVWKLRVGETNRANIDAAKNDGGPVPGRAHIFRPGIAAPGSPIEKKAETLYFGRDRKKGTLAYVIKRIDGRFKGRLYARRTGWVKWSNKQKTINLAAWEKNQEDLIYDIQEFTPRRLVLVSKRNGLIKIYER